MRRLPAKDMTGVGSAGWRTSRYSSSGHDGACVQAARATLSDSGDLTLGWSRTASTPEPASVKNPKAYAETLIVQAREFFDDERHSENFRDYWMTEATDLMGERHRAFPITGGRKVDRELEDIRAVIAYRLYRDGGRADAASEISEWLRKLYDTKRVDGSVVTAGMRRSGRRTLSYDSSPRNWPRADLAIKRSSAGEHGGVYFVSTPSGDSVAVKIAGESADRVGYADNFIRRVGGVSTPRRRIYDAESPDGIALRRMLESTRVSNTRYRGELVNAVSGATAYIVMEVIEGKSLEELGAEPTDLLRFFQDREAMNQIGRLIVLDGFLAHGGDRIRAEFSNKRSNIPDFLFSLVNIMYAPGRGIVAIDNEFKPVGGGYGVLRSFHLSALHLVQDVEIRRKIASDFVNVMVGWYLTINGLRTRAGTFRGSRRDFQAYGELLRVGKQRRRDIVNGIEDALSEIGDRALEHEKSLWEEQVEQFPDSPPDYWYVGGLARYAKWRFADLKATGRPSMTHEDAVAELKDFIDRTISGPVFVHPSGSRSGSSSSATLVGDDPSSGGYDPSPVEPWQPPPPRAGPPPRPPRPELGLPTRGDMPGGRPLPAFEERVRSVEAAESLLEGLGVETRESLYRDAGQIVAAHHPPLPMNMKNMPEVDRDRYYGVVSLVAARLHRAGPMKAALLASELAETLGTKRRRGGAPPGASRDGRFTGDDAVSSTPGTDIPWTSSLHCIGPNCVNVAVVQI